MTKEEVVEHYKFAIGYFRKRWPYLPVEDAEDFAAFCAEHWLRKGKINNHFLFQAIGYFRRYGKQTGTRINKRDVMNQVGTTHEFMDFGEPSRDLENFESTEWFNAKILTKDERAFLYMHFKFDLSLSEIGLCWGVKESTVSRFCTKLSRKIRSYIRDPQIWAHKREKSCEKCGKIKPITEFGKYRNSGDGYFPNCKPCRARPDRRWYK